MERSAWNLLSLVFTILLAARVVESALDPSLAESFAQDLMDDDGMDDLNDSGPESDDAVLWRRLILDAVKRGAVESVHHSGSRRFKHLRYHPCYFNPISCFKKRDAEWLGH